MSFRKKRTNRRIDKNVYCHIQSNLRGVSCQREYWQISALKYLSSAHILSSHHMIVEIPYFCKRNFPTIPLVRPLICSPSGFVGRSVIIHWPVGWNSMSKHKWRVDQVNQVVQVNQQIWGVGILCLEIRRKLI